MVLKIKEIIYIKPNNIDKNLITHIAISSNNSKRINELIEKIEIGK